MTSFPVDIWLRGQDFATTVSVTGLEREPAQWADDDVQAVLEGMLREMHRLKYPDDQVQPVTLRGLSWIVNPFEEGGVVIAIEISLGAAVAGPFHIDQRQLETMITRVIKGTTARPSTAVH